MNPTANYIRWLELVEKNWKPVSNDKRENALEFAKKFLCLNEDEAKKLVMRKIQWDKIRYYQTRGKIVKCKICGMEGYSQFWCNPCIHKDWCCECCILLMFPSYIGGIKIPDVRKLKINNEGDRNEC